MIHRQGRVKGVHRGAILRLCWSPPCCTHCAETPSSQAAVSVSRQDCDSAALLYSFTALVSGHFTQSCEFSRGGTEKERAMILFQRLLQFGKSLFTHDLMTQPRQSMFAQEVFLKTTVNCRSASVTPALMLFEWRAL